MNAAKATCPAKHQVYSIKKPMIIERMPNGLPIVRVGTFKKRVLTLEVEYSLSINHQRTQNEEYMIERPPLLAYAP